MNEDEATFRARVGRTLGIDYAALDAVQALVDPQWIQGNLPGTPPSKQWWER